MTIDELVQARRNHMNNLELLRLASEAWAGDTIARGEATMDNLMQQVYALDAGILEAGAMVRRES